MAAISLGACSTAPYSSETDALDKAAASFKTQAAASSPIPAANATVAKIALLRGVVQGNPPPLSVDCSMTLVEWDKTLRDRVVGADQAAIDLAYKDLDKVKPCGSLSQAPAPAPLEPLAIVKALDDYFDGLQSIVEAKDAKAVADALNKASTAAGNLAKEAKASAPVQAAPSFFAKLANVALEDQKYRALREEVLAIDPSLDQVEGPLSSALRVQQSYWIREVAADANIGVVGINATLSDPKVASNPGFELSVQQALAPLMDELIKEQDDVRTDPASATRGLIEAHHKLAAALKSNRGQLESVFNNVLDIASSAQDLISSGAAKPAAGGK